MQTISIHKAKTHLSRLIDQAAKGEPFIITKAGVPMVQVCAIDTQTKGATRRVGFLAGVMRVPDDFDSMGKTAIEGLFLGTA